MEVLASTDDERRCAAAVADLEELLPTMSAQMLRAAAPRVAALNLVLEAKVPAPERQERKRRVHLNELAQKFIDSHQPEFVQRWPREGHCRRVNKAMRAERIQFCLQIVTDGKKSAGAVEMHAEHWTADAVLTRLLRVSVPSGAKYLHADAAALGDAPVALAEEVEEEEEEEGACSHFELPHSMTTDPTRPYPILPSISGGTVEAVSLTAALTTTRQPGDKGTLPIGWRMEWTPCSRGRHGVRTYVGPADEVAKSKTDAWQQAMIAITGPSKRSKSAHVMRMQQDMSAHEMSLVEHAVESGEEGEEGEEAWF